MKRRNSAWCLLLVGVWLASSGCRREASPGATPAPPTEAAKSAGPLRILVVDDPDWADVIESQWRTIAEEPIAIRKATSADLAAAKKKLDADVVLLPTGLLGEFAERQQIVPVPDEVWNGERLDRRDLLELARQRETVWGQQTYAIPLGSRQLVLWYRADLFEQLQLEPPKTWEDYQRVAARLAQRDAQAAAFGDAAPAEGTPWSGTLEPWGKGWSAPLLLVRAASYARHRGQYSTLFDFSTMEPLLETPPFAKALEEMVAAAKLAAPGALEFSPDDVRREFLAGHAGMALTWPAPESGVKEGSGWRVGFAEVPGSRQMYNLRQKRWESRNSDEGGEVPVIGLSGRLGVVTKESRRGRAAWNFLLLMSRADWSVGVLTKSAAIGPSRRSHLASPQTWFDRDLPAESLKQLTDVVQATNKQPNWLLTIRIPGRDEYFGALDESLPKALRGELPPGEALTAAAERWCTITKDRDTAAQRAAYRRCLGIEK